MRTTVVHMKKDHFDVRIDRMTIFGNPFSVKRYGRDRCIELYKEYFYKRINEDPNFRTEVLKLRGKILGCWCKPQACHGDIIADHLNAIDTVEKVMEEQQ